MCVAVAPLHALSAALSIAPAMVLQCHGILPCHGITVHVSRVILGHGKMNKTTKAGVGHALLLASGFFFFFFQIRQDKCAVQGTA